MSIQLARAGVAKFNTPPHSLLEDARREGVEKILARAVITDPEGRYLLLRRSERLHRGGVDELVGGGMNLGERLRQALKREVLEELQLRILGKAPFIYSYDSLSKEGRRERTFVFDATVKGAFSPSIDRSTHTDLWIVHHGEIDGLRLEQGTIDALEMHQELKLLRP